MKILFTIIIPTHNSSSYIANLLDTIPSRDDIEVIIVDDHSADFNTLAELTATRSDTFTIQLLQNLNKNSAGAARNVGLAAAQGKWLIFADSDDSFGRDFAAVLNDHQDSDTSIVLFPPSAVMFGSSDPSNRTEYIDYNFDLHHKGKISKEELSVRMTPIWSKMYRRDKVQHLCFSETKVANDVRWAARAAFFTIDNVSVDDRSIYTVTERQGSLTRTKRFNASKITRRVFERIRSDLWLKSKLMTHGHGTVKLARHRSVFRRAIISHEG